jgi:ornithine decarboxylase
MSLLPIKVNPDEPLGINQLLRLHDQNRTAYDEAAVLYIDKSIITRKFDELTSAFPPNTRVHYAMKCNPTVEILQHIHTLDGRFELASYKELTDLQQALRQGGADEKEIARVTASTLFSNPVKSRQSIRQAYAAGLRRFGFQGINELLKIAECAPGAEVYLRLTTPVGQSTVASESKFGMTVRTEDQQHHAAGLLLQAQARGLVPYGLTFHVGSQMENPDAWERPLHNSAGVMRLLQAQGVRLRMLDIGGGFPAYHNSGIPTLAAFGAAIRKGLSQLPYDPETIAIEPGRALVSDAGAMVATVIGTELRGEGNRQRKWVYLNIGAFNGLMEALETNTELRFPIIDERRSAQMTDCVLTGPSCDGQDTITNSQFLSADITDGDRVIFYTTGAYTTAYASNFNGFPVPAIHIL